MRLIISYILAAATDRVEGEKRVTKAPVTLTPGLGGLGADEKAS